MDGQHHQLNENEFKQSPADGGGQRSLVCLCYSPWDCQEVVMTVTEQQQNNIQSMLLLLSHFSHVRLCVTPQTAAHQAPRPWDSPGKNTGVGCHFLLQCMKVKSESEVAKSCPTLSDSMDCSPPGSSVHRILQARVLEWGAISLQQSSIQHCPHLIPNGK